MSSASPGLSVRGSGFQTRENALSCNDRALAPVKCPRSPIDASVLLSSHSRRRGLQTPPHVHLTESGQSGLERETGAVYAVIGGSGNGIGRPATRAKALNLDTGAFTRFDPGLKSRAYPRTESPGLAQLRRFVDPNGQKCL